MKTMLIATVLLLGTVAQAAEPKAWATQSHCIVSISAILAGKPDDASLFLHDKKDVLLELKTLQGGTRIFGATETFKFPKADAEVRVNVNLFNYDEDGKPANPKRVLMTTTFFANGKPVGMTEGLEEADENNNMISSSTALKNPYYEYLSEYRMANKASFAESFKQVYPDLAVIPTDIRVQCLNVEKPVIPVGPTF
jgi:hypothetical protein